MTIPPPVRDLRRVVLSGARWAALARLVAELATLASSVVLARLIPPAEFGRAAVALIIVAVAAVLGTAGLVAPIVQRQTLEQRHIASTTFLALLIGSVMTGLTALFGAFGAASLFDDATSRLILLTSPVWILIGIGATSQALLQRALRFRRQALIEGISAVSSVCVALAAAIAGLDGEALVAGALTLVGVTGLLSLASAPPGRPTPSRRELTEISRSAALVAASSLAYLGYRNVDYAILGLQATPAQVGFYWRAYQLGVAYQGKISRVMLRISLPIYSRATETGDLKRMRMRIVRTHATVLIPLLATFVAVAPTLVPWMFGSAWEPTVLPAQILALAGMADAIMTGSGPLMVAIGRPGALFLWNLVQLVLFVVLIVVLAPHGVVAVAVGVALFALANALGVQALLLRRYVGLTFLELWHDIRAGTFVGLAVVIVVSLSERTAASLALPEFLALACLGAIALFVGGATLRAFFRAEWRDVMSIVGLSRQSAPTSGVSARNDP